MYVHYEAISKPGEIIVYYKLQKDIIFYWLKFLDSRHQMWSICEVVYEKYQKFGIRAYIKIYIKQRQQCNISYLRVKCNDDDKTHKITLFLSLRPSFVYFRCVCRHKGRQTLTRNFCKYIVCFKIIIKYVLKFFGHIF